MCLLTSLLPVSSHPHEAVTNKHKQRGPFLVCQNIQRTRWTFFLSLSLSRTKAVKGWHLFALNLYQYITVNLVLFHYLWFWGEKKYKPTAVLVLPVRICCTSVISGLTLHSQAVFLLCTQTKNSCVNLIVLK